MASKTFTGQLRTPLGESLRNARVVVTAVETSETVAAGTSDGFDTSSNGSYSISLEYGVYDFYVRGPGARSYRRFARRARVDAETSATTLNALAEAFPDSPTS